MQVDRPSCDVAGTKAAEPSKVEWQSVHVYDRLGLASDEGGGRIAHLSRLCDRSLRSTGAGGHTDPLPNSFPASLPTCYRRNRSPRSTCQDELAIRILARQRVRRQQSCSLLWLCETVISEVVESASPKAGITLHVDMASTRNCRGSAGTISMPWHEESRFYLPGGERQCPAFLMVGTIESRAIVWLGV